MVKEFAEHGYWALILGGSSGLGLATARKLAAHGMNLCIVHRNTRIELDEIAASFEELSAMGVEVVSYNIDVTSVEKQGSTIADLGRLIGEKGKIRALIHSIAKGSLKAMASTEQPSLSNADFVITLQNMALSLYDWTSAVFNAGLFADDARVISFTSEGSRKALKHYAAVSAAKAAMEAISRSIALEFAPYGIRSNCIQAGVTDTRSLRMIPDSELILNESLSRNPFKRITTIEDVANVVYLLCKDESSWINGTVIPVDGGGS
jgi:enoyl-[acyl-carrier protein] reductase III